MKMNFVVIITIISFTLVLTPPVAAQDFEHAFGYAFIDNEQNPPPGLNTGEGETFGFGVAGVNPNVNTTVSALHIETGDTIGELWWLADMGRPGIFAYETTYQEASDKGWLSPWEITIQNIELGLFATRHTPDQTNAQKMNFVRNFATTATNNSAEVTWELPDTGAVVNGVRYEFWNVDEGIILSGQFSVPIGITESLTLKYNDIEEGTTVAVRIIPQSDSEGPVSRSTNWHFWTLTEITPEEGILQLTTGSDAGISTYVDTPAEFFFLEFDYRFTTTTGSLEVSLNGEKIGTILNSTEVISDGFMRATFKVEDRLGQTQVPLIFLLSGPSGSRILIDNIRFGEMIIGDFKDGLDNWAPVGAGVIGTLEIQAEELKDDVINSFEYGVSTGNLIGLHKNSMAAKNQLKAFGNMLMTAKFLIETNDFDGACKKLGDAYKKIDGKPRPPDFVGGKYAPDLAEDILVLIGLIDCNR